MGQTFPASQRTGSSQETPRLPFFFSHSRRSGRPRQNPIHHGHHEEMLLLLQHPQWIHRRCYSQPDIRYRLHRPHRMGIPHLLRPRRHRGCHVLRAVRHVPPPRLDLHHYHGRHLQGLRCPPPPSHYHPGSDDASGVRLLHHLALPAGLRCYCPHHPVRHVPDLPDPEHHQPAVPHLPVPGVQGGTRSCLRH